MNVTIESRHECLTIGGEEEGRCGVDVIHGGIPHSGSCPPARGAHGGGQNFWPKSGGRVLELWPGCPARGVAASIHLEAVAATSKSARLRETLPMASRVLDPYVNLIT
jgi:hypothetical protein